MTTICTLLKYSQLPDSPSARLDTELLLAAAMDKAGSANPATYLPLLAKTQYKGVTGKIAFDNRGDIHDGAITLYSFKGGHRTEIAVTK